MTPSATRGFDRGFRCARLSRGSSSIRLWFPVTTASMSVRPAIAGSAARPAERQAGLHDRAGHPAADPHGTGLERRRRQPRPERRAGHDHLRFLRLREPGLFVRAERVSAAERGAARRGAHRIRDLGRADQRDLRRRLRRERGHQPRQPRHPTRIITRLMRTFPSGRSRAATSGSTSMPSSNQEVGLAQAGFRTILHEMGHALGLSHPGDYNAAAGRRR